MSFLLFHPQGVLCTPYRPALTSFCHVSWTKLTAKWRWGITFETEASPPHTVFQLTLFEISNLALWAVWLIIWTFNSFPWLFTSTTSYNTPNRRITIGFLCALFCPCTHTTWPPGYADCATTADFSHFTPLQKAFRKSFLLSCLWFQWLDPSVSTSFYAQERCCSLLGSSICCRLFKPAFSHCVPFSRLIIGGTAAGSTARFRDGSTTCILPVVDFGFLPCDQ